MASIDDQVPSKNPASSGSLGGAMREVFRKQMQQVDVMLPARVVSYDRVKNVASVQPDIEMLTTEGERVGRAPIAQIPVVALGGGGTFLSFPLKAGDLGWIEASDRDISLYMQAAQANATKPNTLRLHNFSDSRFLPDVYGHYQLGPVGANSVVLGTTDGNTHVEIDTAGTITIRAATKVVFASTVPLVQFACPVQFDKPVTMSDELTLKGISMSVHKHQVVAVGSPTLGPQN